MKNKKVKGIAIILSIAVVLVGMVITIDRLTNESAVVPANPAMNRALADGEESTATSSEPTPEPTEAWTENVQFGDLTLKSVKTADEATQMSYRDIWYRLVGKTSDGHQAVGFVWEGDPRLTIVTAEEAFVNQWETTGELSFLRANGTYVGLFETDEAAIGTAKTWENGSVVGTSGATALNWWSKSTNGWALAEENASRSVFNEDVYGTLTSKEASPFSMEGASRYGSAVRLLKIDNAHYVWVIVVSRATPANPPTGGSISGGNTPDNNSEPKEDPEAQSGTPENSSQTKGDPVAEGNGEEGASGKPWEFTDDDSNTDTDTDANTDTNTGAGQSSGSSTGWIDRYENIEQSSETGYGYSYSYTETSSTGAGQAGGSSTGWDPNRFDNSTAANDL